MREATLALATGTPDSTTFLRGDETWAVPPAGEGGGAPTDAQYVVGASHADLSNEIVATTAGLNLLDDADAAAQRTTLGLGTLATQSGTFTSVWPIGSIFISVVSTNPNTLLGFGTWSAFGAGRVLVGLDSGQTEFDTVEETGGSKTHTLTEAQLPVHTHSIVDAGHTHLTQRYPTATGGSSGFTIDTSMSGTLADNTLPTKIATTGITAANTGSGSSFSLMNPYVVVYMWERTA